MFTPLQIAIGAWAIGLLIAAPFGVLFFINYKKIKKKYQIDIWVNVMNSVKLLMGEPIPGIEDKEGLGYLRIARIGAIGWNVGLMPAGIIFFYSIWKHFNQA